MKAIYRLISPLSLLLAYLMLNFAARYSSLTRQCEKKGEGMLLIKEWTKVLLVVGGVIATSYTYFFLSSGSGIINFSVTFIFTVLAAIALLIVYWLELDELKGNKKYIWPRRNFWLLAIYFFSPILFNGASIGLKWGGYETIAEYTFKLRYWALLTTPLLGLLCFIVAKSIKKPRLQPSKRVQQATLIESADKLNPVLSD